jgi:hypothetical protein
MQLYVKKTDDEKQEFGSHTVTHCQSVSDGKYCGKEFFVGKNGSVIVVGVVAKSASYCFNDPEKGVVSDDDSPFSASRNRRGQGAIFIYKIVDIPK